ncbi:MAG: hypothetical protein AAGF73_14795 [Actinomycetota bacterium]
MHTIRLPLLLVAGVTLATACASDDAGTSDTTSSASDTTSSASDTTSSASDTTSSANPGGSGTVFTVPVGVGGTVDLAVDGDTVSIAGLDLADGWSESSRSEDGGDVDLDLTSATATIEVDADVESGALLEVDVDSRFDLGAGTYIEPTIAGDVIVLLEEFSVSVDSFDLADGWDVIDDSQDGESFDVTLAEESSAATVEVEGDVADGRGEIDTESRIPITR